MRFCTTCGRSQREDAKFCTGCGNALPPGPTAGLPLPENSAADAPSGTSTIAGGPGVAGPSSPHPTQEQPPPHPVAEPPPQHVAEGPSSPYPTEGAPARHPTEAAPDEYPTQGAPASYPPEAATARYPTQGAPASFPTEAATAPYPTQDAPAQHPTEGAPDGYPTEGAPAAYRTEGPSTQYPPQGPPSRYPAEGPPSRYPGEGPPGRYPAEGPSTQYPPQGPPSRYPAEGPPSRYPAEGPPSGYPPQGPPLRREVRPATVAVIAVVIAAAGTAAGLWLSGRHAATPVSQPGSGRPIATVSRSPAAASTQPTPTLSSPPASTAPTFGNGTVRVASGLTANPDTAPIVTLLDQYFAAINARNYQGYIGLLTPQEQQGLTPAQFASGFRSTVDSGARFASISTAADGRIVAVVAFTSRQNPVDSVNHREACTNWRISLFLEPSGSGYLIGKPPPGYQASYAACH
jgi:hypothetical protein